MLSNISQVVSRGSSLLWAGETLACFVVSYLLLTRALSEPYAVALDHATLYAVACGVAALPAGIYHSAKYRRRWHLVGRAVVAAMLWLPAVWLVGTVTRINLGGAVGSWAADPSIALTCSAVAIFVTRLLCALVPQSEMFGRRVVVLGSSPATAWIRSDGTGWCDVQRTPMTPLDCDPASLARSRIWAVVADAAAAEALGAERMQHLSQRGIRVLRDDVFLEDCLRRLDPCETAAAALAEPRHRVFEAVTRVFDIVFAVALLLLTLPALLLVVLMVKLEDHGPVLYRQERVGLMGREFTLFKIRSMRVDAEACGPVWAQQRDPRVTRIGGFLRRTHLDELPQLFNILRGDMSVVGPRPERLHFTQQLCQHVPGFTRRAEVKPGLTGWAQVNYPYGASIDDAKAKLSYDLYYVKHRSAALNLVTLLATVHVVLFQKGSR